MYHSTTTFPCFAQHQRTSESPEDFQLHLSVIAAADRQEYSVAAVGRNEFSAPRTTVIVTQVLDADVEDIFDSGHKMGDAVPSRTDKVNKHRDYIKKLTLPQCIVENLSDGGNTTIALVSIAGIPLPKLLLSELQLFCASQTISGYRQKKEQKVAQLIAARVTFDNIYASIGRLGMQKAKDSGVHLPGKPQNIEAKSPVPKP